MERLFRCGKSDEGKNELQVGQVAKDLKKVLRVLAVFCNVTNYSKLSKLKQRIFMVSVSVGQESGTT